MNRRSPSSPGSYVLHPGDVACATAGGRLETLLGSCVAIVLTDPRRTAGAMCHVVNPDRPARPAAAVTAYGDHALEAMLRLLRREGITAPLCEAYVYGGGNMFPGLLAPGHVGAANARWALAALRALDIRVLAHDLGGHVYRRVHWTVGTAAPVVVAQPVARPDACGR